MSACPLSEIKVLDLTHHIAGPYCTKLLGDFGADVIKVEKPGTGDLARRLPPFLGGEPHPEKSGPFLYLNTNKRSLTLNLKSSTGKKIVEQLIQWADVVVESFSPRVMPSLGLSYGELEKIEPILVMTSISNFGQTGPYRDYKASELILYGMGNAMHSSGLPDREPIKMAGNIVQYLAGACAALATLIASYGAAVSGTGDHVDISIQETQLGSIDRGAIYPLSYQYTGQKAKREEHLGHGFPYPVGIAKDGFFDLWSGVGGPYFPRVCRMIGHPELAEDPTWSSVESQLNQERRDEFDALYWLPWTTSRTKQEIFLMGQREGVLVGPRNTIKDVVENEHLNARGFWVEIEHPVAGKLKYPGPPVHLGDSWQIKWPAPLLGQHNEEILEWLGYSRNDIAVLRATGVI